jgi:hypothetical protein
MGKEKDIEGGTIMGWSKALSHLTTWLFFIGSVCMMILSVYFSWEEFALVSLLFAMYSITFAVCGLTALITSK